MVAELSSYQIATTSELHPRVAVLLNITPDHLAWHRTHENYAAAKLRLLRNMDESDLAIVDMDDEGVRSRADRIFAPGRRVLTLTRADSGAADAAFVRDGVLTVRLAGEETALVPVGELGDRRGAQRRQRAGGRFRRAVHRRRGGGAALRGSAPSAPSSTASSPRGPSTGCATSTTPRPPTPTPSRRR